MLFRTKLVSNIFLESFEKLRLKHCLFRRFCDFLFPPSASNERCCSAANWKNLCSRPTAKVLMLFFTFISKRKIRKSDESLVASCHVFFSFNILGEFSVLKLCLFVGWSSQNIKKKSIVSPYHNSSGCLLFTNC